VAAPGSSAYSWMPLLQSRKISVRNGRGHRVRPGALDPKAAWGVALDPFIEVLAVEGVGLPVVLAVRPPEDLAHAAVKGLGLELLHERRTGEVRTNLARDVCEDHGAGD